MMNLILTDWLDHANILPFAKSHAKSLPYDKNVFLKKEAKNKRLIRQLREYRIKWNLLNGFKTSKKENKE